MGWISVTLYRVLGFLTVDLAYLALHYKQFNMCTQAHTSPYSSLLLIDTSNFHEYFNLLHHRIRRIVAEIPILIRFIERGANMREYLPR